MFDSSMRERLLTARGVDTDIITSSAKGLCARIEQGNGKCRKGAPANMTPELRNDYLEAFGYTRVSL